MKTAAKEVKATVIYGSGLMNRLCARMGFAAMTVGRWVWVAAGRDAISDRLLNHETIHIAQQRDLWWVGQWALYAVERAWRFAELALCLRDRKREVSMWREAYYNVSFEREAYAHQEDYEYLSKREKHAWKKYLT
jgi:hypothetical protein